MKLLTKEIEDKLLAHPYGSQDGLGGNAEVIVKFFNPTGAGTWLITEGEKQENGDWLLFGYCHIFEWEWGYVALSDLQTVGIIERDLYISKDAKVKDAVK